MIARVCLMVKCFVDIFVCVKRESDASSWKNLHSQASERI